MKHESTGVTNKAQLPIKACPCMAVDQTAVLVLSGGPTPNAWHRYTAKVLVASHRFCYNPVLRNGRPSLLQTKSVAYTYIHTHTTEMSLTWFVLKSTYRPMIFETSPNTSKSDAVNPTTSSSKLQTHA